MLISPLFAVFNILLTGLLVSELYDFERLMYFYKLC